MQNQFSFGQKTLQGIKKEGLKSKQREIMGVISQICQDRTMCWILFKKAKKSPKDYLKLVSYFGKDFLYLLILSIKTDPAGYTVIL